MLKAGRVRLGLLTNDADLDVFPKLDAAWDESCLRCGDVVLVVPDAEELDDCTETGRVL